MAGLDGYPLEPQIVAAWSRDAAAEHASIASFARFTLELLALAAPADLVLASQQAGHDEVEHAVACFQVASRFAGHKLGPTALDVSGIELARELGAVTAATVREGCVGETFSALVAEARHAGAEDPQLREVLARIAQDEARHAQLGWRFTAWALERGGNPIRQIVIGELEDALRAPPSAFNPALRGLPPRTLRAYGLLDEEAAAAIEPDLVRVIGAALDQLRGPAAKAVARAENIE
jgi:hypothetical protein